MTAICQGALVVEGQTEKNIADSCLVPLAAAQGMYLTPVIVKTSSTPTGARRGGGSWRHYDSLIHNLLRNQSLSRVGLMIDLYGYPTDAPGHPGRGALVYDDVTAALREHFNDDRFVPLVMLHEVEALVLAAIAAGVESRCLSPAARRQLQATIKRAGGPEQVNTTSSPSQRLVAAIPRYVKPVDGPALIDAAGFDQVLSLCPAFSTSWNEFLQ